MKKIGLLVAVMLVTLSMSACGSATNNLTGVRDEYDAMGNYKDYGTYGRDGYGYDNTYGYNAYDTDGYDVYGYNAYGDYGSDMGDSYANGGNAYWDGYGINEGRTITSDTGYTSNRMLN